MTEHHELSGVLQDLAVLYELSLCVGGSLELKENCDSFLRTLMARKNLEYVAVWILESAISGEAVDGGSRYTLVYANPGSRGTRAALPLDHALVERLGDGGAYSACSRDPDFEVLVTEAEIQRGAFAVFPLGDHGLLKLYSSTRDQAFTQVELSKLRHVVEKFAVSLAGCLDHDRVRTAEQRRRDLEDQMLHAQKLESLGVLAGGIAHDFNNLLTAILGNAELARPGLEAAPAQEHVENVVGAASRAAELCSQLLAYSGGSCYVSGPVHLGELVEEMLRLTSVTISKKASIHREMIAELPPVEGNATHIRQVVMNLVTNASEALEDTTGDITVRTGVTRVGLSELTEYLLGDQRQAGDYVYLEVEDSGCGMEPGTEMRLFEPYYTTKFTGRGLGLAAVLGIVRSHHGAIRVRSRLGEGTQVRVLLPMSSKSSGEKAVVPAREGPTRAGVALVVDDEASVRKLLTHALEREGFRVLQAADGGEALELFQDCHAEIDLVLLDLTMPVLNGDEVMQRMRLVDPDVRIVLSSGYSDPGVESRAGGGPTAFLEKPFRLAELKAVIGTVMATGSPPSPLLESRSPAEGRVPPS